MVHRVWQVQTAKQRFSELVRAAESGEPQFISRHGRPVAVVIDVAAYRGPQRPSFARFLIDGPTIPDLELPERQIEERPLDL